MLTEREAILLGALVHDLGKFWQRTGEDPGPSYDSGRLGSQQVGAHGAHARWSAAFCERHLPSHWQAALRPVLYHHNPHHERASLLVTLADWLSAAEREDSDTRGGRQARQGASVLSQVHLAASEDESRQVAYLPLLPLNIAAAEVFTASSDPLPPDEEERRYLILWQGFVEEHARLPKASVDTYISSLLALLRKYCWCVPASFYRTVPDISLYDHLRTTCAFATALDASGITAEEARALWEVGPSEAARAPRWAEIRFTLLAGDLSGIQRFLYTLTSHGVARGLKGRSFYLQLLSDAVVRWLVRELKLSAASVLTSAGGHFTLLAPRLEPDTLGDLRLRLGTKLAALHGADLAVALGARSFSPAEVLSEKVGFASLLRDAHWDAAEQKRRRLGDLSPELLQEELFTPRGGLAEACVICRREPAEGIDPEREGRICTFCESLERLGQDLRDPAYLLAQPVAERDIRGPCAWYEALASFGWSYRPLQGGELGRHPPTPGSRLVRLQDTDFLRDEAVQWAGHQDVALGFRFLGHATPRKAEEPQRVADFQDLAERSEGVPWLGVLRMDVDDLGQVFVRGLGQQGGTPSRLASLSFLFQLFFEGRVSAICSQQQYRDKVYLIYSGGDDLFLVGSWDTLPELAHEIRQDFDRFSGSNPDLHLSAGLALVPPRFPLYQSAEDAGEALDDRAKQHPGKDAFHFLGFTIPWSAYAEVAGVRDELRGLVERARDRQPLAPRALLHVLQRLYVSASQQPGPDAAGAVTLGRWHWQGAYSLTRMGERLPPGEGKERLRRLRDMVLDGRRLPQAALAARWVELLLRKKEV